MTLYEEIQKARYDSSVLISLIERFSPLLKKYTGLLHTEDAYADIQLKFIELILHLNPACMRSIADPYILSYLRHSIHNHYIYMAKQEKRWRNVVPISSMLDKDDSDNDNDFFDKLCSPEWEDYRFDDFDLLYKSLTYNEASVIVMLYYYRMTVKEVAIYFRVSPSAISRTKSRAIRKLRSNIIGNA